MHASYTLHADEFPRWAERMKTDFHGKTLRVIISDKLLDESPKNDTTNEITGEEEPTDMADLLGMDETEYLMSDPVHYAYLLRAMEDVKAQKNLVPIPFEDLDNVEKIKEHAKNFQERRAREEALEREALENHL